MDTCPYTDVARKTIIKEGRNLLTECFPLYSLKCLKLEDEEGFGEGGGSRKMQEFLRCYPGPQLHEFSRGRTLQRYFTYRYVDKPVGAGRERNVVHPTFFNSRRLLIFCHYDDRHINSSAPHGGWCVGATEEKREVLLYIESNQGRKVSNLYLSPKHIAT